MFSPCDCFHFKRRKGGNSGLPRWRERIATLPSRESIVVPSCKFHQVHLHVCNFHVFTFHFLSFRSVHINILHSQQYFAPHIPYFSTIDTITNNITILWQMKFFSFFFTYLVWGQFNDFRQNSSLEGYPSHHYLPEPKALFIDHSVFRNSIS